LTRLLGTFVAVLAVLFALGAPPAASADPVTVRLTNRVSPADLTISPGTTVVFRNESGERHRLRAVDHSGDDFDTGNLEPGESAAVTFPVAGRWTYVDDRDRDDRAFHGTIIVAGSGGSDVEARGDGSGSGVAAPASADVTIGDRVFSPGSVTIAAGGTVTWRNADGDEHTASARDGSWDSGIRAPGAAYSRTFPAAGTFAYLCLLHPEMTGTVVVRPAAAGSAPEPPIVPGPTPTPAATPPAAPDTVDVTLSATAFDPSATSIAPGGTVRWLNPGPAIHTVTADGGAFESGLLRAGDTFSATFEAPGRYPYVCAVHPWMAGTIIVGRSAETTGARPTARPSPPSDTVSGAPAAEPPADGRPPGAGGATIDPPTVPATAGPDTGAGWRLAGVVGVVAVSVALFGRVVRSTVRPG
jgi:plastocyanin